MAMGKFNPGFYKLIVFTVAFFMNARLVSI